jgi:hypothetical protein
MTITSSSCGFDGATTLSIMTFSIMTLGKLPLFSLGGPGIPHLVDQGLFSPTFLAQKQICFCKNNFSFF